MTQVTQVQVNIVIVVVIWVQQSCNLSSHPSSPSYHGSHSRAFRDVEGKTPALLGVDQLMFRKHDVKAFSKRRPKHCRAMFLSIHRLNIASLRIGKHRIVKKSELPSPLI